MPRGRFMSSAAMSPTSTPPTKSDVVRVRILGSVLSYFLASVSTVYSIIKDVVSPLWNLWIQHLEEYLTTDIRDVIAVKDSVSRTTAAEYEKLKEIENMTIELWKEHYRLVDADGINSDIAEPDISSANDLMRHMQKETLKLVTRKPWKLALLHIRLANLNTKLSKWPNRSTINKKGAEDHWTNDYVDEVLRCLETKRVVGIAGPVGIGKTTVIEMLRTRLRDAKSLPEENDNLRFHQCIRITSKSEEKDKVIETLQNQIMKGFNMREDDKTDNVHENGNNIAKFLNTKKYILLMDDVSSFINLQELGFGKEHEHEGKLVIVSRSKKVAEYLAEHVVEIKKLSIPDSKILFNNIHGEIDSGRKQNALQTILEGCGGIPQEIRHIAKLLKLYPYNDESSWNSVRDHLRGDVPNQYLALAGISSVYKMEYEKLEDQVKKCLLYEALFPLEEHLHKDYLIECWMAEEFIDTENGLQSGREQGGLVLKTLTNEYLLTQISDDERFVTMPPYFRRVALDLNYSCEYNYVLSRPKKHDDDIWKKATRISLIKCKKELPPNPQCKKLRTLLMQHHQLDSDSYQLSDDFFGNMKELRMLDLEETKTNNLPENIGGLESLRCLYLTKCDALTCLPEGFSNLQMLQLLDIFETGIGSLPEQIKGLANLRCLRATLKPSFKGKNVGGIILPNIIGELKKLEELSIGIDPLCEGWKDSVDESIVDEMASLEHLNSLRYNFPDMQSLIKFASSSKSLKNKGKESFKSFEISVDSHEKMPKYAQTLEERRLSLYGAGDFHENITAILVQAKTFELIGAPKIRCLNGVTLDEVEVCLIRHCRELEYIINSGIASKGVLQYIKKLHLYDLESLQHIWEGPVWPERLKFLAEIKLHGCPKLETILNPELANALPKLKYLEVVDCSNISHVLDARGLENQSAKDKILNELESLKLSDMPKLESICISTWLNWESLRGMVITNCDMLKNLTTLKKAQRLKTISCGASWEARVMQQEENKWLKDKLHIIDESSAVRAHHGSEASTYGGTINSIQYHATPTKNQFARRNKQISANGNEENASSDDKQDLIAEGLMKRQKPHAQVFVQLDLPVPFSRNRSESASSSARQTHR